MALPKRRHSKSRTGKRRAHDALKAPSLSVCPQYHEPKLPHFACPSCGTYRGRKVAVMEEE
jgi:large subunit ribosomal protein L32